MISRSKKYRKSVEGISPDEALPLSDALQRLNQFEKVNFDETVEISCSLGVDPKQSAQSVRGIVNYPMVAEKKSG
jgi:large subunit ribosomal protein L1